MSTDKERQLLLMEKIERTQSDSPDFDKLREIYEQARTMGDRELINLRLDDIKWRIRRRPVYGALLIGLLFVQNLAVFAWLFWMGPNISKVENAFNFLITGTLIETALIVRIIVEWLFKEIDFSPYKRDKA